jgi:hypothetical protein
LEGAPGCLVVGSQQEQHQDNPKTKNPRNRTTPRRRPCLIGAWPLCSSATRARSTSSSTPRGGRLRGL